MRFVMNRLAKHFVLWMMLWLPLLAVGQTERFEAVVIDAQTRQTLPFASVFVNRSNSTMTNAEGSFSIECAPTDMLRISFVGYQTRTIAAGQMGRVVELHTVSTTLDEVTVKPYSSYLKEAIKEAQRQLKKNRRKKANFFYRQTAYADSVCYEFMEAFLSGHSSVFLRDLALSKGRFAGIQPDSLHYYSYYANFFSTSQIQVTYMPGTKVTSSDRYPLSEYYESNYDVSFDMIGSDNDRLLAAHFTPKPTDKPVLDATLYLDANTYRLRKIEGRELNLKVMHRKQRGSRYEEELAALFGKDYFDELIDTEFHFVVNMTEDREFLEVESVIIEEQHELYGKTIRTSSMLFNVGDRDIGHGRLLDTQSNMHDAIESQGYDKKFWRENEIVLRTPVEQEVLRLFESRNLFGVF